MKRKHLALLLAAAMTVTSVDATALVSAADFSAEVTEDASVVSDESAADVDITDTETDVEAETDSEETDVEVAEDAEAQENSKAVTDEGADFADTAELFNDGGEAAEEAGEQSSFIPTTGVTAMSLNTEYTINFTKVGEEKWYSFTPTEAGSYIIEAVNDDRDKINVEGEIYEDDATNKYEDSICNVYVGTRGVKLAADQTYYYRATWSATEEAYTQGGSYKVKIYKAPAVKNIKIEAGSAKTEYCQGLEVLRLEESKVTLEYADGKNEVYTVSNYDELDELGFCFGFYDNICGVSYRVGVSGAEESNKDIKNVGYGRLKKTGKYKVQVYEYGSTDAIGDGYEINVLPAPSMSLLKTGTNSGIVGNQWYKYIPDTTGIYYIPDAEIYAQDFEECDRTGDCAFFLEKEKTYYIKFDEWAIKENKVTIALSPKVTGFTVKPFHNEGAWGEAGTEIIGEYHIIMDNGTEDDGVYYTTEKGKIYDKYGHTITVEVKDSTGKPVQDFTKKLKVGKYTYQVKIDGYTSEDLTYTVKEVPVYTQLKEGKNNIKLSVNYYQFVPETTGLYSISGSYAYVNDAYYMDVNGEYQSTWVEYKGYRLQKGKTYYIIMEKEDGLPDEIVDGSITITKLADETCEWSSPEVKTPATCGKAGEAVETCKLHGDTRTVLISPTGKHTYKWNVVKAATAVTAGTQVQKCSVCGAVVKSQAITKLAPTLKLNLTAGKTVPMKVKQSFNVKVTGLANGDGVKSWKSNKTKIATVRNGKITAKKTGTAKITVTLNSGYTTWFKVKVQKSKVNTTSLKVLNKATGKNVAKKVTLKRRGKLNLSAVVAPVTSKQKVTFSSSKKSVATVNSKGVVTAKKKGKATITVKSGKKTVKIKITVK